MNVITSVVEFMNDDETAYKIFSLFHNPFPDSARPELFIEEWRRYLENINPNLLMIAEDSYIDKVYRDSFSNYFSTKFSAYDPKCIRLSFMSADINPDLLLVSDSERKKFNTGYFGFMVLRPILSGPVGRTAISPKAILNNDKFICCTSNIRSSCKGLKTYVEAFPHSSQDNEYSTCAETSIWTMMEYYGNKYPEYTHLS